MLAKPWVLEQPGAWSPGDWRSAGRLSSESARVEGKLPSAVASLRPLLTKLNDEPAGKDLDLKGPDLFSQSSQ